MKKYLRIFIWVGAALIILGSAGFVVWANNAASPEPVVIDALNTHDGIVVEDVNNWLVIRPSDMVSSTGLILYPGGRVDYRAYSLHARDIARAGFTVVVVPMPLNLAFLAANRGLEVIEGYPNIDNWVIGGHSLGGAMAAEFASSHPDRISGLVLWAAYPAENNDLSGSGLPVLSVYGTLDGLATIEKIESSRNNLPADTSFVAIEGGNHAGFGRYGNQQGDGSPEISPEVQQALIVEATVIFLSGLETGGD